MKLLKITLVALLFIINLAIAPPSLADRPKIEKNPDYIKLTQTLNNFLSARDQQTLPEGITAEQMQQTIADLKFQKYIMEAGEGVGLCRNETQQTLAVYGPKSKKSQSTYDNELYLLSPGQETDDEWDCKGIYLPNDVNVAGLDNEGAAAAKIVNGTRLIVTSNAKTGVIDFNAPLAQVFKADEVNWEIPNLSQTALEAQFPKAPIDD